MGCGCGGKAKPKVAKTAAVKTTGAWKLTGPNGEVSYFDSRVAAQAANIRTYNGKGIAVKNT